jgi:transcription elongation factor SPT6
LLQKPVHKFVDGQFLQIVQAETDGLVTIEIKVEEELKLVQDLCKFICNDYANELAEHWNNERKRIAEFTAQDILFPQTVKWLKDKLLNTASELVAARCQMALERKISMAPYKIPENDEDTPIVMAISWGNGERNDSTFCVILNENGVVIEFKKLDKLLERDHLQEDVQTIIDMISRHKPDAVAVGGFKPNTKTGLLKIMMESVIPGGANEPDWNKDLPVYLVEDEIARIYMTSKSGQREFPEKDYPPLIPYCVSLSRFVQEPICEYAALFNTDEDIKNLRLDPMQKYLIDDTLLKSLERGFINVVNNVGVDINSACSYPHLSHTLKFVSGLGPRKAQSFISKIVRSVRFFR